MSLTRRRLLLAGAAAAALPRLGRAQAKAEPLRIGAILPIGGTSMPPGRVNLRAVGEAARMGLVLGEEDATRNGELLGWSSEVTIANAPGAEAAARAARRLVARDKASVLVEAEALSQVAGDTGTVFFNIAASSDTLRHGCARTTFHVEASAAMYIDAIFGWFVRAGYRRWYLVNDDGPEGQDRLERALANLKGRHWGAEVAGRGTLRQDDSRDFAPVIADIAAAKPDVVLLLTDWQTQLDFLSRYEISGVTAPITGFPEPAAQMRDFYLASGEAAPKAGSGRWTRRPGPPTSR